MNKLTKKFSILLASVAMAAGVGLVGGANSSVAKADVTYKSSIFSASNNADGTNNYTSTVDNTTDGFSVTVANGHNNHKSWDYFRFGQKKAASKGSVTTKSPIDKAISKISVTIGEKCSNVNGIYVYANTTSTFANENKVGTFTGYKANTTITADLTGTSENMYYKVEFDMAQGVNGALEVNQIDFIISGSSATADAFIAAIAKIPAVDALTIADKDLVEAARKEYGYLIDTLKAQEDVVAALATLEAAEAKIAELEKAAQDKADETAAAEVDALINAIGEVTDYSKAKQIKAARDAYEALSDNAKTKVNALETLVAAETALAEYAPVEVETTYKSSIFSASNNAKPNGSYTSTVDNTTDGFSVTVANGNNNNNGWSGHFRFGSNKAASKGSVTTKAPIDKAISKISVTIGEKCSNVNGIYVYANTTSTFANENKVGTFTGYKANTTITADLTGTSENMYYKVEFDMPKTSGNGTLDIGQIDFIISKSSTTANEFIAKWNVYSADYCTNVNDEAKRAEILALIAEYEALDADVKAIVDANIDLTGTAMARSIEYAKNHIEFLNNTATGEGSTGTILSAVTESGASTIAIVAALVLLTFVGYVVISKKKLVK